MADETDPPRKKPPKQHLLGCFGCRSTTTSFKPKASKEGEKKKKKKKKGARGWGLYWSISKSAAATVPVEEEAAAVTAAAAVELEQSGDVRRYSQQRPETAVLAAAKDGPLETPREGRTDDGQKMESMEKRSDTLRRKRSPPYVPPPPPPDPITISAVILPKPKNNLDNRLDPIVGMSIVMVTLIVLVSWGQVCAVLCTAAWFFVVPRLRRPSDRTVRKSGRGSLLRDVDMSSEEYKKRVVLEGLLERNHRPDFFPM